MSINSFKDILNLNTNYQIWNLSNTKSKAFQSIAFLNLFTQKFEKEKSKLPYRLNLLDDLSTNENAHSKLLIRILQYKPALIHFLNYINSENKYNFIFETSLIDKPILTYEKMRIDGLIREFKKYAIIIENKIHNAVEQKHQIGRYIEKCESIGFDKKQIYIVYLTRTDKDTHSEQTWGEKYKLIDFNYRYTLLSYESKILPWLESFLNTLSTKEELIKSSIVQYIDHLKHIFNNKQIYKNMNKELQEFLIKELKLNNDYVEIIQEVDQKIDDINSLKVQLEELRSISIDNLFSKWRDNLEADFNGYEIFFEKEKSLIKTGIKVQYLENTFSILIEYNYKSIYYGIGRHTTSHDLDDEITQLLNSILDLSNWKKYENWWYGWDYTEFDTAYSNLENLINLIIEKINHTEKKIR